MKHINIHAIYRILQREFSRHRKPVVDIVYKQTKDPFKVLISAILSARTRDDTTMASSRRLFKVVQKPSDLRRLNIKRIESLIYPVGFYRAKARYLKHLPYRLEKLFGGRIPDTVEELIALPGVGRKTANLVVAVGFGKPAICVDVHVHRICNRLGYVKTHTPFETEMELRKRLSVRYWSTINSLLVSFGQHQCLPRYPLCGHCPIKRYCRRVGVSGGLSSLKESMP